MIEVKVLGAGCTRCSKLYAEVERAIDQAGVVAMLDKVETLDEIMDYGVMVTPALVIAGTVRSSGRVPSASTIAGWLTEAAQAS